MFLSHKRRPLLHAETVLLVNHAKPQIVKDHAGFDKRMRADEHLHFARGQSIEHRSPTLSLDIAREQSTRMPNSSSWAAIPL